MTDPACEGLKKYTYETHRFRFAAWVASRAVLRVKGLGAKEARCLLKAAGFCVLVKEGVDWLPTPKEFDAEHRKWCETICEKAKSCGVQQEISHGIAAKLINVFLKALTPADLEDAGFPAEKKEKWYAVHPPIDGMVLKGMKKAGIGNTPFEGYKTVWAWLKAETDSSLSYGSWTEFEYRHYRKVICMIRCNLRDCGEKDPLPLWKNERFFKP